MIVINIRGFLVNLFIDIDPDLYGPFVTTYKKGKNMIIVKYINALYRNMMDGLLYCKNFERH